MMERQIDRATERLPMTIGRPLTPSLRVAARRLDVTPDRPVTLGCSPDAGLQPVDRIAEPLEVNVVAMLPDLEPVVVVALDTLYPSLDLREAILAANPRLPSERLVIAASHTHQAPMLLSGKPTLGTVDLAYLAHVREALAREVRAVLDRLDEIAPGGGLGEGRVRVGTARASHSINRRLMTRRGMRQAPNPGGPTDETIAVAVVEDGHGPVAILWNYACHPVGHPDGLAVSAHFPHHVRQRLRSELGRPELPVVYFQGFSGDVRPSCSTRITSVRGVARTLKWGRSFHEISVRAYQSWASSLAELVASMVRSAPEVTIDGVTVRERLVPRDRFVRASSPGPEVRFQFLGLGASWAVITVGAELVTDYARAARAMAPEVSTLMCVGCTDEAFGYIPTRAMLAEGGYEAEGFCTAFGYDDVRPDVEEVTLGALSETIDPARYTTAPDR
jgi:neutral ceramidase